MATLYTPSSIMNRYAFCIDASLPNFKPDQWIQQNRLYRVKYITQALNSDSLAMTIMDKDFNEITPSSHIGSFKYERFVYFDIVLN